MIQPSTSSAAAISILLGLAVAAAAGSAEPGAERETGVGDVLEAQERYQGEARSSQRRIDALDDETLDLIATYHGELDRTEDLLTYNQNMRELIASQRQEAERMESELDEIEVVRQALVPLMVEMVEVLGQFIELDQPMLATERRARLEALRSNLTRANVDIAEKYRRVIEAYQIEAEYGQSLEAYEGPVRIGTRELTVDFLRVGRVGLYYLSLDRQEAGIWDPASGSWAAVPDSLLDALDYAVRVARKQAPPNLIELPLWTAPSP